MSNSKFIAVPPTFEISVDKSDGNYLLSSNDKLVILKIGKENVSKKGAQFFLLAGSPVIYVKRSKVTNRDKKQETEILENCPGGNNKKYCQNGITLCCDPPHVIVGTCVGDWSDC